MTAPGYVFGIVILKRALMRFIWLQIRSSFVENDALLVFQTKSITHKV